ncbi:hypothetical protein Herod_00026 [Acinetobacter phage Herod]|nr:hypothetical protein Herod_00026 [Acinetobacter phage Herod]
MSELNTTFAPKLRRLEDGKIEVSVYSNSFHKSNQNLLVLSKWGFELSETVLSRTQGNIALGSSARFIVFVNGTDDLVSKHFPLAYAAFKVGEQPKEEPVKQADIPKEVDRRVVEEKPAEEAKKSQPKRASKAKSVDSE